MFSKLRLKKQVTLNAQTAALIIETVVKFRLIDNILENEKLTVTEKTELIKILNK